MNYLILLTLLSLTKTQTPNEPPFNYNQNNQQIPTITNFPKIPNMPEMPDMSEMPGMHAFTSVRKNLNPEQSKMKESPEFQEFANAIKSSKSKNFSPPEMFKKSNEKSVQLHGHHPQPLFSPVCFWKCHVKYWQCRFYNVPEFICNFVLFWCYTCAVNTFGPYCWNC